MNLLDRLPLFVAGVFALLAAWHFYMAIPGGRPSAGAVPSVDGRPLFAPSPLATAGVGLVLVAFAVLVLGKAGLVFLGLPQWTLAWMCFYLAAGLSARAVGDFRYVGFFKTVRGSRFARLDTLAYSPLCLALAAGVLITSCSAPIGNA